MTGKSALIQPALNSLNWNTPLNANFGTIDNCFGATINFNTTSANVFPSSTDCKSMRFYIYGALTNDVSCILPAGVSGSWIISNVTTGNYIVYLSTTDGSTNTVALPKGDSIVYSNGSQVGIASTSASTTPAGTIAMYGGGSAPSGWVLCDGSSYSSTGQYSILFAAIGYTWGGSAGTFLVPDLRGMFVRGTGTNGAYPTAAGASVGGYQADLYLNHSHTATSTDSGHTHTYTYYNAAGSTAAGVGGNTPNATSGNTNTGTANITTTVAASTTGGTETRPKSYSMWYMIKY